MMSPGISGWVALMLSISSVVCSKYCFGNTSDPFPFLVNRGANTTVLDISSDFSSCLKTQNTTYRLRSGPDEYFTVDSYDFLQNISYFEFYTIDETYPAITECESNLNCDSGFEKLLRCRPRSGNFEIYTDDEGEYRNVYFVYDSHSFSNSTDIKIFSELNGTEPILVQSSVRVVPHLGQKVAILSTEFSFEMNTLYSLKLTEDCLCGNVGGTVVLKDSFFLRLLPMCASDKKCFWISIGVASLITLLVLIILLQLLVLCCKKQKSRYNSVPPPEIVYAPSVSCSPEAVVSPGITWELLHLKWELEPPENPAKILLLYSRDSESFVQLQASLISFLTHACHCEVLDLFDDLLFETIAVDLEGWMNTLLLNKRDYKVLIVSSPGAFKRINALDSREVLNIPDNSALDGLFSAGLKFFRDRKASSETLATLNYEFLTETNDLPGFQHYSAFDIPGGLHSLFCWIHGYDPLSVYGKPWVKYQLELQLLTDSIRACKGDKKLRYSS